MLAGSLAVALEPNPVGAEAVDRLVDVVDLDVEDREGRRGERSVMGYDATRGSPFKVVV